MIESMVHTMVQFSFTTQISVVNVLARDRVGNSVALGINDRLGFCKILIATTSS